MPYLLLLVFGGGGCQAPIYVSPEQSERTTHTEPKASNRDKSLSARSQQSVALGVKNNKAGNRWKKKFFSWLWEHVYWVGGGILLVLVAARIWKTGGNYDRERGMHGGRDPQVEVKGSTTKKENLLGTTASLIKPVYPHSPSATPERVLPKYPPLCDKRQISSTRNTGEGEPEVTGAYPLDFGRKESNPSNIVEHPKSRRKVVRDNANQEAMDRKVPVFPSNRPSLGDSSGGARSRSSQKSIAAPEAWVSRLEMPTEKKYITTADLTKAPSPNGLVASIEKIDGDLIAVTGGTYDRPDEATRLVINVPPSQFSTFPHQMQQDFAKEKKAKTLKVMFLALYKTPYIPIALKIHRLALPHYKRPLPPKDPKAPEECDPGKMVRAKMCIYAPYNIEKDKYSKLPCILFRGEENSLTQKYDQSVHLHLKDPPKVYYSAKLVKEPEQSAPSPREKRPIAYSPNNAYIGRPEDNAQWSAFYFGAKYPTGACVCYVLVAGYDQKETLDTAKGNGNSIKKIVDSLCQSKDFPTECKKPLRGLFSPIIS